MSEQSNANKDLNEGLGYVQDLPGFDRGHPHYFKDPMIDHLLEICLQLAGEIWVNRDRQMVIEHLLATEGKVTPDMIEAFKPEPDMKENMRDQRRLFTQRLFGCLYDDNEAKEKPEFLSGVVNED